MSKELFRIVGMVALEKGLPEATVVDCLEKAMAGVCRKSLPEGAQVRVMLHPGNETFRAWRVWEVAADDARLEAPSRQLRLMDALEMGLTQAQVGSVVEEPLAPPTLTRVAARALYQQLLGHVRQAERDLSRQAWEGRLGEMVYATVKRRLAGRIILDVEGTEASLDREHQISGERLKVGARVAVTILSLNENLRGAPLVADRRGEALLESLMMQEVPELRTGEVRIRAIARGARGLSKVLVESTSTRVDPVASCVGIRGSRIQAVAQELANERIHLTVWSDNLVERLVNAMSPIQPACVVMDEQARMMDVAVAKGDVFRGRAMAPVLSRLLDWQIQVLDEEGLVLKQAEAAAIAEQALVHALSLEEDLARLLVEEGFMDVESIALCSLGDLLVLEGMDEATALEIQGRAQDSALANAMNPSEEGVWAALSPHVQAALREQGVDGDQALAECAVDEIEGVGGLDSEAAAEIIMAARQPWLAQLELGDQAAPKSAT